MRENRFDRLRNELLESGIARRHVRRIVAELNDHFEDLVAEAKERGLAPGNANEFALRRIGNQQKIAQQMLSVPELRAWIYRYPRIARIYLPIAYALLLPAAPVFAGVANPGIVIRWGAALMLGAGVTAAMMLSMQLAIALT